MTSQIISNSTIAPASLISFNLLNDKERNKLYLLGGAQTLALEVTNISDGNLTFTPSSQLILSFRPGTLINANNIKVAGSDLINTNQNKVAGSDWSLENKPDMLVSLVFKPTADVVLEPKGVLILNLTGIEGDNRGDSRPSQVELKIQGIRSAGQDGNVSDYVLNPITVLNDYPGAFSLVATAKKNAEDATNLAAEVTQNVNELRNAFDAQIKEVEKNFGIPKEEKDRITEFQTRADAILDDVPKIHDEIKSNANAIANISQLVNPLFRVDILNGTNTILSDSVENNLLELRISTTAQETAPNSNQVTSEITTVRFDFSELGKLSNISLVAPGWEVINTETDTKSNGIAIHPAAGSTSLLPIDVTLTFSFAAPEKAGLGRLNISYSNLTNSDENKSDGEIYLLLYKSPLAIGSTKVGIGTHPGNETLKVQGDVAIDGALSVTGKTAIAGNLSVTGTSTLSGTTAIAGTLNIGAALTISDGKVSSNPAPPEGYSYTQLQGAVNITRSNDSNFANQRGFMAPGSLTIGSTDRSYGGGTYGWNSNPEGTAGLLLETKDNTEIAVHDHELGIASFMYYESAGNKFTIGRPMDSPRGPSPVTVAGSLTVNGKSELIGDTYIGGELLIQGSIKVLGHTTKDGKPGAGIEGQIKTNELWIGPNLSIQWRDASYEGTQKPTVGYRTSSRGSYQRTECPGYFWVQLRVPQAVEMQTMNLFGVRVEEIDFYNRLAGIWVNQAGQPLTPSSIDTTRKDWTGV